jgi:catechol 2,3-dioxygenase-like lactoylglutathione lyase family enzyme
VAAALFIARLVAYPANRWPIARGKGYAVAYGHRPHWHAFPAREVPPQRGGKDVKPRLTLLTLGVDDLDRAVRFYRDGLGWHTEGIVGEQFEGGAVAFFDLQAGLKLALWPRSSLAADTKLPSAGRSPNEFSLGHNVDSRRAVDDVMAQAVAAGAYIVKRAQETVWGGYAGYFQDPDGHVWEIAWNPQWVAEADDDLGESRPG